jgi:hypothetical protein
MAMDGIHLYEEVAFLICEVYRYDQLFNWQSPSKVLLIPEDFGPKQNESKRADSHVSFFCLLSATFFFCQFVVLVLRIDPSMTKMNPASIQQISYDVLDGFWQMAGYKIISTFDSCLQSCPASFPSSVTFAALGFLHNPTILEHRNSIGRRHFNRFRFLHQLK